MFQHRSSRRRRAGAGPSLPRSPLPPAQIQPPAPPRPTIDPDRIASSPFAALGLRTELVRALLEESYETPTPIQSQVVAHVLAKRDVIACAQTGTGKTAAFVLPILQGLASAERTGAIRALILTPTRELASQIAERIQAYGRHLRLGHAVVFGGVSQHRQEIALRRAPDILVATPGRLLDLIHQGIVRLDRVTHLVLDEADRMLDMGFVRDVRSICTNLPRQRQTLLFSATMPTAVDGLARAMLVDPIKVSVTPASSAATTISQSVMFVPKADKRAALVGLLGRDAFQRTIIFTRTKHGANRLADQLSRAGIVSEAIHGNKSQGARERALEAFRTGTSNVLVATDVASRGLDVDGISHVINYEMPMTAESYVHRIGRTGRAGATGEAITLCDPTERAMLSEIERLIRQRLSVLRASGSEDEIRGTR